MVGTAVWIALVLLGLGYLTVYEFRPGVSKGAPKMWPKSSHVALAATVPTLIMFAHPHCPCTRASIEELAVLMAHNQGKLAAHVLFIRPEGTKETWTQTDLWRSAAAIPGVTVAVDEGGREAGTFGEETSGGVVLYNAGGKLLFSGGITESRGHAGDNEGLDDIAALVRGEAHGNLTTATYGCPLVNSGSLGIAPICRQ